LVIKNARNNKDERIFAEYRRYDIALEQLVKDYFPEGVDGIGSDRLEEYASELLRLRKERDSRIDEIEAE
jgi:hypothetical protein